MFEPNKFFKFLVDLDDLRIRWEGWEGNKNEIYQKLADVEEAVDDILRRRLEKLLGKSRCGGCEHYAEREVYSEWSCGGVRIDQLTGKIEAIFYCRDCGNRHPRILNEDGSWG